MANLKLSACIEMLFSDQPGYPQRVHSVADVGVNAVEFWGYSSKDLPAIRKAADERDVTITAFTCEADADLVNPDATREWVEGARESITQAGELGVPVVIVTTGQELESISRREQHDAIINGLQTAAPFAEKQGVTMVLEPLNTAVDHAGYYLDSSEQGFRIVRQVNSNAVGLLYDIYHQQVTEGNLIQTITENIELIGHFHVADVPGRHEPGTGEINYANVFTAIRDTDYEGYVGLEFRPSGDASVALRTCQRLAGG